MERLNDTNWHLLAGDQNLSLFSAEQELKASSRLLEDLNYRIWRLHIRNLHPFDTPRTIQFYVDVFLANLSGVNLSLAPDHFNFHRIFVER